MRSWIAASTAIVLLPFAMVVHAQSPVPVPVVTDTHSPEILKSQWGPLALLAGHGWRLDFEGHLYVPSTYEWIEPGRVLERRTADRVVLYDRTPDGSIHYSSARPGSEPVEGVMTIQPDGSLLEYLQATPEVSATIQGNDKRIRDFLGVDPGGQVVRWQATADDPDGRLRYGVYRRVAMPLADYPQDGSIPAIQIGQEAVGDVGSGKKFRRMPAPVPVYMFAGRKGQRICARADSADGTARVHIGRLSKNNVTPIWTGILPRDPIGQDMGSSVLVTIPEDGNYYLYASLLPWKGSFSPNATPLSFGGYEMKLWDADFAEPASISPVMTRRPSGVTSAESLGAWDEFANRPFVGKRGTVSQVIKHPDGSFVFKVTGLDGSLLKENRYLPTGRRGIFQSDQGVAEIQCDGSVIFYPDASRNAFVHYHVSDGIITIREYFPQRASQPYAHEMSLVGFPMVVGDDMLFPDSARGRRDAARMAELAEIYRKGNEENARYQAALAREQGERSASRFANAIGAIGGAFAGATMDNDRMRRSLDQAAERGIAEGNAIRAKREAQEARARAEDREQARRAAEQARAAEAERVRIAGAQAPQRPELQPSARVDGDDGSATAGPGAGAASTATDATMCVAAPVVGPNPAFAGATLASVINGCPEPVDVRICLMGEGGWDCGVTYGIRPQEKGSYWRSKSSGEVFWDARTSGSSKPLRSPD